MRTAPTLPLALLMGAASTPTASDYAADARDLAPLIAANYAYLDDLPGGGVPTSPALTAERDAVHDADTLLPVYETLVGDMDSAYWVAKSSVFYLHARSAVGQRCW